MNDLDRRILATTLERERQLAEREPIAPVQGDLENARLRVWEDMEAKYGPRFSSGEWFGPCDPAEARRLLRGVADLERRGLLACARPGGSRVQHCRLTPAGRAALEASPRS